MGTRKRLRSRRSIYTVVAGIDAATSATDTHWRALSSHMRTACKDESPALVTSHDRREFS